MLNTKDLIKNWPSLKEEIYKDYFLQFKNTLALVKKEGTIIFPPTLEVFSAFDLVPLEKVKVVILGQDPYHGAGQAHGLSFSVKNGTKLPPSLKNIFKELESDLRIKRDNGDLSDWAKQGVFLLNTVLTVQESKPGSHSKIGWEKFTNKVIEVLSKERSNLVFVLWGKHAQSKKEFIDPKKHLILESSHPSPFSAHRGFLGSKPFSGVNKYLKKYGNAPICW